MIVPILFTNCDQIKVIVQIIRSVININNINMRVYNQSKYIARTVQHLEIIIQVERESRLD